MNDVDEKYQQQILFEDEQLKSQSIEDCAQIVFENQDWQPDNELLNSVDDIPEQETRPRWLMRMIFALFSVIVVIEAVEFFTLGFSQTPIVAALYAALLFCLSLTVGATIFREVSGLRQLKAQQQIKQKTTALLKGDEKQSAKDLCTELSAKLPCDLQSELEQQWADVNLHDYNDQEILQLYTRTVLTKVDQKAVAEIAKFSSESVVLIALSPVAIIDMFIMFSRNLRLVNKIAGLYGLKLGYWSRIKLIKQVIINVVYAGASELVADFGADMLGADMLGKLSGRLAQGLGAGLLTARLGLKTLQLVRPIPFEQDAPKLGHIRKEMISQIKQLALNKA
ncbi:YcjF family protein [Thalassotalea sp. PLHSN55]|uniref:YcjF family protein n=1 Tax=Thalassotalea sp. PLHSN55 TaxID=3435888 RepID=UPI003F879D2F